MSRLPAVFTISFGSLPGLALAADARWGPRVGTLVIFGGALDTGTALRFCVGAHDENTRGRDPLNLPAVFLNLGGQLGVAPAVEDQARGAWHHYVRQTWGRPEMKAPERYRAVAAEIGATLDEPARGLFLLGCGIEGDVRAAVDRALQDREPGFSIMDRLGDIRCPVVGFHGMDDDVIPHDELDRIGAALPPAAAFVGHKTGWIDHTRSAGASLSQGRALVREARTMWTMLDALAQGADRPAGTSGL